MPMTPPFSDEAHEKKMIALAMAQAESLMESGDAPPGVILHFVRLGSERSKLEMEKLRAENEMLQAKTKALEAQARSDELFQRALDAFAGYRSSAGDDD